MAVDFFRLPTLDKTCLPNEIRFHKVNYLSLDDFAQFSKLALAHCSLIRLLPLELVLLCKRFSDFSL